MTMTFVQEEVLKGIREDLLDHFPREGGKCDAVLFGLAEVARAVEDALNETRKLQLEEIQSFQRSASLGVLEY